MARINIKGRLFTLLYGLDCFLFVICTLGAAHIGESFSSAAWRAELNGMFYGKVRPLIDSLFFVCFGIIDHCQHAYETAKYDLPADMR
jgi:hypothetical protein